MRSKPNFLSLILCSSAFASDFVVELPKDSAALPGLDFYVDHVWDVRVDSTLAGMARTGFFNSTSKAVFKKSARAELSSYFDRVAPKADKKRPVSVEIQELKVEEQLGFPTETATAEVRLAFKARNGQIFTTFGQVQRSSGIDVTEYHGSNLAMCLNMSLRKFASLDTSRTSLATPSQAEPKGNSLASKPAAAAAPAPEKIPFALLAPQRSLAFGGWIQGWKANSLSFQFLRFQDDLDHWTYPAMVSIEAPLFSRTGIEKMSFLQISPSIVGMRRISSKGPWTALLQAGLPLGYESVTKTNGPTESGFFVGLNAAQCIAYVPNAESGLAFQAGPYESFLLGSDLYPYDLGLKISVGWKY